MWAHAIATQGGSADPGNPAQDFRVGRGANKPEDIEREGAGQ